MKLNHISTVSLGSKVGTRLCLRVEGLANMSGTWDLGLGHVSLPSLPFSSLFLVRRGKLFPAFVATFVHPTSMQFSPLWQQNVIHNLWRRATKFENHHFGMRPPLVSSHSRHMAMAVTYVRSCHFRQGSHSLDRSSESSVCFSTPLNLHSLMLQLQVHWD